MSPGSDYLFASTSSELRAKSPISRETGVDKSIRHHLIHLLCVGSAIPDLSFSVETVTRPSGPGLAG